jgi:transcriptional regulator GlxA family with amidase domain
MSKRTLNRAFTECFGKSPMAYVIELRMRHAQYLLSNSAAMVRDISLEIGSPARLQIEHS